MKLVHFLTVTITVIAAFCAPFYLSAIPASFEEAKKIVRQEIFFDQAAGK
ncbi:MAG: hypothetical protein AB8W37_10555 [Arsenophonus endosymbiont of Dermacentor nuttalli]